MTISVEEKKLRGSIVGMCHPDGRIQIDPRQTPRHFHSTAVHESIHAAFPELTEAEVLRGERIIAGVLWRLGYRRCEL